MIESISFLTTCFS